MTTDSNTEVEHKLLAHVGAGLYLAEKALTAAYERGRRDGLEEAIETIRATQYKDAVTLVHSIRSCLQIQRNT